MAYSCERQRASHFDSWAARPLTLPSSNSWSVLGLCPETFLFFLRVFAVKLQKTQSVKAVDIEREWFVVDATDLPLGRLASEVAQILRGKHKPTFTPHIDTGDHVVVVNAEKIAITSDKSVQKIYYRHSGFPGGLNEETFEELMSRQPERIVERAVRGMIAKNRLGRQVGSKLKVYAGPDHPHQAQMPKPLELNIRKVES
jgi:large subunit ribosomal protein L13